MMMRIISEFIKNLDSVKWLDAQTRSAAKTKAKMFSVNIGGPDLADYPVPQIDMKDDYMFSAFKTIVAIQVEYLLFENFFKTTKYDFLGIKAN